MIRNKFARLARLQRPAGDGDGGSGSEDRGDTFVPTEDNAEHTAAKLGVENPGGKDGDGETVTDVVAKADKAETTEAKADEKGEKAETTEGKADDKRKDTRIPVARHKEILAKEREARAEVEQRLAKYEGGQKVAATNEAITKDETKVLEMEAEYNSLVAEGKTKDATEKMRDIRALDRTISERKTMMAAEAATARAVETVRYETTVERLEAAYPQINPEHDDFDDELSGDVVALSRTYVSGGLTPSAAIQKAVKRLCKPATAAQEKAVEVTPNVDKDKVKETVEKDRKAEAAGKTADAIKKQPPSTAKVGADSDRAGGTISATDVLKMDQKDFNKLDEKTLARMRGDEL